MREWYAEMGFKSYHDPQDEPSAGPLDPFAFDFDYGDALSKEQLKGENAVPRSFGPTEANASWTVLIYQEVMGPLT